mgnify:CR=1 FL=1
MAAADSTPYSAGTLPTLDEVLRGKQELPKWMGWRLRLLVVAVLTGCAAVFLVAHWLTSQPRLPLTLKPTADGQVRIQTVDNPALQRLEGHLVEAIRVTIPAVDEEPVTLAAAIDVLALHRSSYWISSPQARARFTTLHEAINRVSQAAASNQVLLQLGLVDTPDEPIVLQRRGWSGLSPLFWLLALLALTLFSVGWVVVLAGPQWRNVAFFILTMCQATQLMFIAVEHNLDIFLPDWFIPLDASVRAVMDAISAGAIVQIAMLHPRKVQNWPWVVAGGWVAAAVMAWGSMGLPSQESWWWVHGEGIVIGLITLWLVHRSLKQNPHPFTLILQRFGLISLATWSLLLLSVSVGRTRPDMQLNIATFGVMTWHVFFASELLLAPYLSRSKRILQEFSMLAASSTVAASMDLLFVAVFSLGQFTSMTLSLFLAFGSYVSVRRWLISRMPGRDPITMERLFERLYRIARELEAHPDRLPPLLLGLMQELFEPLDTAVVRGKLAQAELRGNGSVLLMPMPSLRNASHVDEILLLKHAGKGLRLFTSEDARLADRVIDQLGRALNFDQAVEQGRSEERLRIAQDLHDDIGARLLTLMYQAPNSGIEEYIRHTLQDLKTLTRGLAAQSHTLNEAAGEWKRDLSQRLSSVHCELVWQMAIDHDVTLTMVQWSALTRILRELVNNTISHAKAKQVRVDLQFQDDCLTLSVSDNGVGSAPQNWSHGLGLGGVRKRVKQLGGIVVWQDAQPKGIRCEVKVPAFSLCPVNAPLTHGN